VTHFDLHVHLAIKFLTKIRFCSYCINTNRNMNLCTKTVGFMSCESTLLSYTEYDREM